MQSALVCAKLLNFIFLALLVFYFFKISGELKWSMNTELIAFSFCFFNFPVLKLFGYYPLLCDCPALLLSYMGVYYYLKRNLWCMGGVGLLAMLTWPFLCVILFILALFPRDKVVCNSKHGSGFSICIRCLYVLFVTFIYFIPIIVYKFGSSALEVFTFVRPPVNMAFFYLAIVSTMCFYAISAREFDVNWRQIFEKILDKSFLGKFICFSAFFITLMHGIGSLGSEAQHTAFRQIVMMVRNSTSDILIFLETHFLYLGLFFLLILLLWKRIVQVVCNNYGMGYLLVLMLALFFLIDTETRKLTSFYPILLIPLMDCLQRLNLKPSVVCSIPFLCLLCSFFWFPINTPNIAMAFDDSVSTYVYFPAQRFFMFMGPWQSHQVYLIVSFVEIIIGIIIVLLWKKGFLVNR